VSTKISGRGLSAEAAIRCCRFESTRRILQVRQLIGGFVSRLSEQRSEDFSAGVAVLPAALATRTKELSDFERLLLKPAGASSADFQRLMEKTTPKITNARPGTNLGPLAVIVVAEEALRGVAAKTAALETATGILGAMDQIDHRIDACEFCVRKKMWTQKKKQKKETTTIRRRQ